MTGILVPLITPFTTTGAVDLAAVARLAAEVLDDGAAGLVALGTTAEVATLGDGERADVLGVCSAVARERGVPLVVGVGGNDTARVRAELAALGDVPGVTGALALVPPYTRPSLDGVVAHFEAIAPSSPVPLIVYNVPLRTGLALDAATMLRIARIPNVVGTKHAVPVIDADAVALLAQAPDGFEVYGGDDGVISPLLALGAVGGVLASAHVRTRRFVELVEAWRDGDTKRGRAIGNELAPLSAALFAEPNPAVIKGVLHATGRLATPDVRLPLLPATEAAVARAQAVSGD